MIIAPNETRVTPSDIFNFEDWNTLSGDRRTALGVSYDMMAEDKVTSYLGGDKD